MPADNTVSANSLKTENENQAKEWEKIRDLFEKYDERLHDLRKYGFTFLTGLLTVGSFVTQTITSKITVTNVDSSTETLTPIPGIFNLGVFVITLLLIIALHLFDKNYRVFQSAAMTRAKVLERKLNLELSETISERYKANKIERYVSYVYLIFIIGVAILGIAILYPSSYLSKITFKQ